MAIRDLVPWKWGEKKVPVQRVEKDPFYTVQQDLDRLFEDFFSGFGLTGFGQSWSTFSPNVDVFENDKEIKVSVELPGMDEKDIEVSLDHNVLTIRGEKKQEKEDKGKNYYHLERSYGSFHRAIPLPLEVESDKVEATFKKGVLNITLVKSAQAQRKRIAVKTG